MKRKTNDAKKLLPWREALRMNRRALGLLYKSDPQMLLSRLICTAWVAVTPYVGIRFSAQIVSELAGARDPQRLKVLVLATLISAAAIALVTALLTAWRDAARANLPYKIEQIYMKKLLSMDFISADDPEVHAMFSTVRQNALGGGWGLWKVPYDYETIIKAALTILGGTVMTVSLFTRRVPQSAGAYTVLNHPAFIAAVIAAMLAITYLSPALSNRASNYRAFRADLHNLGNRLYGFFGWRGYFPELAADIRMYRQDRICEKYSHDKTGVFESRGPFAKLSKGPVGLLRASAAAVSVAFTGVVYAFVCLKAWAGAFDIGAVTQYVASVTMVSGGVASLIAQMGEMRTNASFLKLTFAFLDIPNPMYQGSLTTEKRADRRYEVEFKNVSFRYPGSETYALRNVNMKFRVGSRLAVVGRNGSGKTTFIKLLCRLYDPTEGEILLNGIDIRKYRYDDYLQIFSVVFQDFWLLALPLGQNVAAGTAVDAEKAVDCLEKAGFGERLAEMADGLDTCLYKNLKKDGVTVSGGEAQKIAIARALYKDAPFIILDEPTAALDPIAEAEIYSKFNEIVGDRTAIYISHRLSSCKFCDEIAVFDGGTVVEQGSHAELVADESSTYFALWHAQAQYYEQA